MVDISYKNTLKKTTIEIDEDYLLKIHDKKDPDSPIPFVPPLFDEYVIRIIKKDGNKDDIYNAFANQLPDFLTLPDIEKQSRVKKCLRAENIEDDAVYTVYVKYQTATQLTAIYFEPRHHKKNLVCSIGYENDNGKNKYRVSIESASSRVSEAEYYELGRAVLQKIIDISGYMQNRGDFIVLYKIEVSKLEKNQNKKTATYNKGYSQKIKLKSKIKKYILSEETERQRKTYRKITPCWYVRGYYRHYGKDKVLKYIPPQIKYRAEEKLKLQQNKQRKPKSKTYEIVDNE